MQSTFEEKFESLPVAASLKAKARQGGMTTMRQLYRYVHLYQDPALDDEIMQVERGSSELPSTNPFYIAPPAGFVPYWGTHINVSIKPLNKPPQDKLPTSLASIRSFPVYNPRMGYYILKHSTTPITKGVWERYRAFKLSGAADVDAQKNESKQAAAAADRAKVTTSDPKNLKAKAEKTQKTKGGKAAPQKETKTSVLHNTSPTLKAELASLGVKPKLVADTPETAAKVKEAQAKSNLEKLMKTRQATKELTDARSAAKSKIGLPSSMGMLAITPRNVKAYKAFASALDDSSLAYYFDSSTNHSVTVSQVLLLAKERGIKQSKMRATLIPLPEVAAAADYTKIPQRVSVSKRDIVEMLRTMNVSSVTPENLVRQPPLVECTPQQKRDFQVGEEPVFGFVVSDLFPDFLTGALKVPSYLPSYTRGDFDRNFVNTVAALASQETGDATFQAEYATLLGNCKYILHNNYFGNSSLGGQIGRYMAVIEAAKRFRSPDVVAALKARGIESRRDFPDSDHGYRQYRRVMDKLYPLRAVDYKWAGDVSSVLQDELAMMDQDYTGERYKFTSVVPTSQAGPLVIGNDAPGGGPIKNGNFFFQNVAIANHVIDQCAAIDEIPKLLDNLAWATLGLCKPKAEVFERERYSSMGRNIIVQNAGASMPANMLLRPTHSGDGLMFGDHPTSISMKGWSPWRGGMTKFVNHFISAPVGTALVYSDNYYVLLRDAAGVVYLCSMDGSKHESSVTRLTAKHEMRRTLDHFKGVSKGVRNYALWVYPNMAVDANIVLGNNQLRNYGLGSGNAGTDVLNNVKTCTFHEVLQDLLSGENANNKPMPMPVVIPGQEVQTHITWTTACQVAGVNMKCENTSDLREWGTDQFTIINADVLGMSFVHLKAYGCPGEYVGVLEQSRLLKSLCFQKRSDYKLDARTKMLITLMRYKGLYLIGGWFYSAIARTLNLLCSELLDQLEAGQTGTDEIIDGDLEGIFMESYEDTIINTSDAAIQSFLLKRAVPTFDDVIRLATSDVVADNVALFLLRNLPSVAHALVPVELLVQISQAFDIPYKPPKSAVIRYEGVTDVITMQQYLSVANRYLRGLNDATEAAERISQPPTNKPAAEGKLGERKKEMLHQPALDVMLGHPSLKGAWANIPPEIRGPLVAAVAASISGLVNKDIVFTMESSDEAKGKLEWRRRASHLLSQTLQVPQSAVTAAIRQIGEERFRWRPNHTVTEYPKAVNLLDPDFRAGLFLRL